MSSNTDGANEVIVRMWAISEALARHATVTTNTARAWRALIVAIQHARTPSDVPTRVQAAARDALGGLIVELEQLNETVRSGLRAIGRDPDQHTKVGT